MVTRPIGWRRSFLVAAAAAYGPFVVTTLYTLAFVDCGHCKEWMVRLLPVGPGFLASAFLLRWAHLPVPSETVGWLLGGVTSAAFVAAVAAFGRLGAAWLVGAATATILVSGCSAVLLLLLLRA